MDAAAWERILGEHGAFLQALARERMRRAGYGPGEAEEVLQEVWTSFLKAGGPSGTGPDRDLRPYLAVAVLNAARSWLRTQGRREARETLPRPMPSVEAPDEPLLRREDADRLGEALSRLDPREQILLRWVYWEGLGYAEVARLLDVKENSVGPLLTRARERLRGLLGRA